MRIGLIKKRDQIIIPNKDTIIEENDEIGTTHFISNDTSLNISDYKGIIEEVGFRSTRIRTLSGHLVTIPNGELASQMIENISKRPYIKRTVEIGVTYDTSLDKIEEAKSILSEILSQNPHSHKDFPPRIYFKDFNSSSLQK